MGWEPATFYVYDADGRLVSSRPEPEFDESEREWFQALASYRTDQLCGVCGLPKSVCRAPEAEDRVKVESERCHVTAAIARRQKADAEDGIAYPQSLAYNAAVAGSPEAPDEP